MKYGLMAALVLHSLVLTAQTSDPSTNPEIGSWVVNVEKSTYRPGPAPRTSVLRWEPGEGGFTVSTFVAIDAQGNPAFNLVMFKYDGKDYGVYSNGNLPAFLTKATKVGTGAYKRVDAHTVEATIKDNTGKITATATRVVSSDGKTLTATGKDPSGKVTNVTTWEKQ